MSGRKSPHPIARQPLTAGSLGAKPRKAGLPDDRSARRKIHLVVGQYDSNPGRSRTTSTPTRHLELQGQVIWRRARPGRH